MSRVTLINYGRWYYDHGSTYMPVMTDEQGTRDYLDRHLRDGDEVCIRNATPHEHQHMAEQFDWLVDDLAKNGFVSGLGNFDTATTDPERVRTAVAELKTRARTEPMKHL